MNPLDAAAERTGDDTPPMLPNPAAASIVTWNEFLFALILTQTEAATT